MEEKQYFIDILNTLGYEYNMEEIDEIVCKEPLKSTKKCICFSRVSTSEQDLVQQTEAILSEARRCGFSDDRIIVIEQKESAVKLDEEERVGIQRLKDIIEQDDIECVIIYEISRLSRRPDVLFSVRDYLIKNRVNLICITPYMRLLNKDYTMSQTASLLFSIFGSMAENEGFIRKARTQRGKEKKKALGLHYTGRVPFGYKTNKLKEYILDPMTAPLVKKIFNMYVKEDVSLRNIVKELQSQGFFTNITFHGCVRNIHEMLHREYYCGTVKGYPQIISKELFDKAQEIKKRKTICSPRTENKALLKGILYNKETGFLMQGNTSLGAYHASHGGGVAVKMSIIEPIIWDYTVKLHKEYYSKDYEGAIKEATRMIQLTMRKEFASCNKIREYDAQIERLEERVVLGKISASKADMLEEQINKNLKEEEANYRKICDDLDRYKEQENNILEESKKQYDYTLFGIDDKIELIKKVIDKIIVSRDETKKLHIEIYNKYNDNVENIYLVRKWRNWIISND
jgi:DNA invertase Pin-like site-specific DNA recombinase